MTIHELSVCFLQLEKTSARLTITQLLSGLFSRATADEIAPLTYLSLSRLAPKYENIEFQIAEKMMVRVLALAYNANPEQVQKEFKEKGDLGDVAYELAKQQPKTDPPAGGRQPKTIQFVFDQLLAIAVDEGKGSQERKVQAFAELLKTLDPDSAKFVVRMPIGALRLGFSDMTILDALSWMQTGDKSLRKDLEQAFNVSTDIGRIARVFKQQGIEGIKKLTVKPGIPIRPQQSERLPNAEEIIKKIGESAIEYKLDGLRAQVHIFSKNSKLDPPAGGRNSKFPNKSTQMLLDQPQNAKEVRIFSRNLEDTTHMFPEIVEAARKLPVDSAILDGEAIGYNPTTGTLLPFQETSQRKRKHGIEKLSKTIPVKYFAFDLLYLNGEDLLQKPFKERRAQLEKII